MPVGRLGDDDVGAERRPRSAWRRRPVSPVSSTTRTPAHGPPVTPAPRRCTAISWSASSLEVRPAQLQLGLGVLERPAGGDQRVDLGRRHPGHRHQDLAGVLAHRRPGPPPRSRLDAEVDRVAAEQVAVREPGRSDAPGTSAGPGSAGRAARRWCRTPRTPRPRPPAARSRRRRPRGSPSTPRSARRSRRGARCGRRAWRTARRRRAATEQLGQRRPRRVVVDRDRHPRVVPDARVHALRRQPRQPVARALRHRARSARGRGGTARGTTPSSRTGRCRRTCPRRSGRGAPAR